MRQKTERHQGAAEHTIKDILLIAHRLSTVRECDQIFLLKQGRLEAAGTPMTTLRNLCYHRANRLEYVPTAPIVDQQEK